MNKSIYICFALALLLAIATQAAAKRGCNYYGHSCYGGHGKRSLPGNIEVLPRTVFRYQQEAGPSSMDAFSYGELSQQPADIGSSRLVQRIIRELLESRRQQAHNNEIGLHSNEILSDSLGGAN